MFDNTFNFDIIHDNTQTGIIIYYDDVIYQLGNSFFANHESHVQLIITIYNNYMYISNQQQIMLL